MAKNNWAQKLQKLDGAVIERKNRYAKVARCHSPSVNYIFGKGHGLPRGYTAILYGPPKGGKSVLSHMMIGHLHQTDPEAWAIKFDTEYRADTQLDDEACEVFGIDQSRLQVIQTNSPVAVFDQIEKEIAALVQAGMPLALIVIDSMNGIQGRREMELESVTKQTIGDHAQTIQIGMKRILPVVRNHDIALVGICQARAELDLTEQMRGNKYKMAGAYGLQHQAEYFIVVEEDRRAAAKKDLLGREFVNASVEDMNGKGQKTAMKILVTNRDSSMGGGRGRAGQFAWNFRSGYVNRWEEIVRLAEGYGVLYQVPGAKSGTWGFEDLQWCGKENMIKAVEASPELQERILNTFFTMDDAGAFDAQNEANAKAMEGEVQED